MAFLQPFLRNPLSDVTGALYNHQLSRCAEFEMRMMECLEAYGVNRGQKESECKALADDFHECVYNKIAVW